MAANRPQSPEYVTYARIAKNQSGTTCLEFRSPAPQSHAPKVVPTVARMLGELYPDLSTIKSEAVEGHTQSGSGTSVVATTRVQHRSSSIASAVQNQADTSRAGTPSVSLRHPQSIPSAAARSASVRTITPAVVPDVATSSTPMSVGSLHFPVSPEAHRMRDAGVRSVTATSSPSVLKLDDVDPQTYKRETKLCQLTEDEKTAMRSRKGKAVQVERTFTAWFESTAALPLATPPDLSAHDEIQLGDLYWHESPLGVQLWLWAENEDDIPVWKPVRLGLSRESDGRRLFLNPSGKPSWMTNNWYHKQKAAPRNVFVLRYQE
uniref:Catalytic subunit of cAMP-dependent protein kinase n=1 Tax=Ganoderma boninense TaxID=34458 RepID=A0A5K1K0U5_9APHY|nr:Catalytic subunit of cAMP-dependent protein kinase [Ganoderma boninense]